MSGGEVEGEVGSLCRTILLVPAKLTVPTQSTHGANYTLGQNFHIIMEAAKIGLSGRTTKKRPTFFAASLMI